MSMHAQHGEDVRLSRAFAGQTGGFYVDVGANHPVELSATKHFYDVGWCGVNVEPTPWLFKILDAQRPRDLNLNIGCGSENGRRTFYVAPRNMCGLSTFNIDEVAAHARAGVLFDHVEVDVLTLGDVFERHVDRQVDFLSIDVERHERDVLLGVDLNRFRPRVVVVEAVLPNTAVQTHADWEHLLLGRGYLFAVFDDLNRFYVREEDSELAAALASE